MLIRLSSFALAAVWIAAAQAAVINVPSDAPTIQAAINMAVSGDEIVLADGTYTGAGNRDITTQSKALTIRSASDDPTQCVIDAQRGGSGFLITNQTMPTIIRGVTIERTARSNGRGGALFVQNASATAQNCRFISNIVNVGGGAVFKTGSGQLLIEDCFFQANRASFFGGAIEGFNLESIVIRRSVFLENTSSIGGAIEFGQNSNADVVNCLFVRNEANGSRFGFSAYGGGAIIAVNGGLIDIDSSTFVGNTTSYAGSDAGGGGLLVAGSTVNLSNSLFWENADPSGTTQDGQVKRVFGSLSADFNLVQNLAGLGGAGNIDGDPEFRDASSDDYRLGVGSAAVDAGNNALVPLSVTTDLGGDARFIDAANYPDSGSGTAPIVDIGAYEAPADLAGACPADLTGDGAVGASDLAALIASWNQTGGPADFNGDGVGADDLASLIAAWGPCP